jgi:hypothetical protein
LRNLRCPTRAGALATWLRLELFRQTCQYMLRTAVIALLIALSPAYARAEAKIALLIGNEFYDPAVGVLGNIALVGRGMSRQSFDASPAIEKRTDILGAVRDLCCTTTVSFRARGLLEMLGRGTSAREAGQ